MTKKKHTESEEKNLRSCAKRRKKKDWKSWRKKLETQKTEEEIWKIINRERKKRADIEEEISMEEWEKL